MIQIRDLKKIYVDNTIECIAINGVNLDISSGEFVAITGRSGSGKSTLLYMIGALESFTEGSIIVNGNDIYGLSKKELSIYRNRCIGFVFQDFYLEPTYTVFKNVEMPLIIAGIKKKERKEKVFEALEKVGMLRYIEKSSNKLSGGERQRVSIARALVNNPQIVLADEPCGNLDTHNSSKVMEILREISNSGKTVLLVTHDDNDAKKADRIIRLQDGLVV